MQGLPDNEEFSFKDFFIPLTTIKAITIIVFVGLIVYINMLFNGFVWDDRLYIILNPDFKTFNPLQLIGGNLFNALGQYRPIPALYFGTLFNLFKDTSFFYHFIQLALHITNASLVYLLLNKYIRKDFSLFAALIFLVHPIQIESVSFISATVSPLFFFFGMVALLLSIKSDISIKRFFRIGSLLLLALFTKETGILFLLIILLHRIIFNKRKQAISFFVCGAIVLLIYCIFRFGIAGVYFDERELAPIAQLSLIDRIINIPSILFYYLKTFFFPWKLAIDQMWVVKNINFNEFFLPLFVDICFFIAIAVIGKTLSQKDKTAFKVYIFFTSWFIIGILLHLQIIPLDLTVSDRWFYFPMVGLLGIVSAGAYSLRKKDMKIITYTLLVIITTLLSIRTMVRNTNWSTAMTLYTHDMKINNNFDMENNLAAEYSFYQDYQEQLNHALKSVSLLPYEINIYNVGYDYEVIGNTQKAREYYYKALEANNYHSTIFGHKHNVVVYIRLAQLLIIKDNNAAEAKRISKLGLSDYPNSWNLWLDLAISEYQLHNQQEAIDAVQKAELLSPGNSLIETFKTEMINKQPLK